MEIYSAKNNYNYYLRNAYSKDRKATRSDYRAGLSKSKLVGVDSSALRNISSKLRELDYDTDHSTDIIQNTKVFIETYNNLLTSTDNLGATGNSVAAIKNRLTRMTKQEKDDLATIGIEFKSNGQLKLDEKTFGECKPEKIKRILSSDNTLTSSIQKYATQIYRASTRITESYSSTGSKKKTVSDNSGGAVNVTL